MEETPGYRVPLLLVLFSLFILFVWCIVHVHPKPLMNVESHPPLVRTSPTGRMTLIPLARNERVTNVRLVTYTVVDGCLQARFVCEVASDAHDVESEGVNRFLLAPPCENATENVPYVRHWDISLLRTDGTDRVMVVDLPTREPMAFFRSLRACASSDSL